MNLHFSIPIARVKKIYHFIFECHPAYLILIPAVILSLSAIIYFAHAGQIVSYGDSESHLNIAKRVIHSLTPGVAQLGGIWLPLPHILMLPFIWSDMLWQTGLAGSIVGSFCYLITAYYLYKLTFGFTKNKMASLFASYVFMINPNILYLQSTAMTELPLIIFFTLSSYYFIQYLRNTTNFLPLLVAALFGFCAVLSRYDGWFLVIFEAMLLVITGFYERWKWQKIEGLFLVYGTLAFFGVLLWLGWGQLILGNAFYFTQSEFSARTQQQAWLAKGELPAYHNLPLATTYYFVTSLANSGLFIFAIAVIGFILFVKDSSIKYRYSSAVLLLVPFIFNVVTQYIGQSVIFIPHLTPVSFEWRLFNVRYGVMMIPFVAILVSYVFFTSKTAGKLLLVALMMFQYGLFAIGYSRVVTLQDGIEGLSHAKQPDAESWMKSHYDSGLVLLDDYARTISIVRSGIPMQKIIYIGNKPYWSESLITPEKYATWIVMQKSDAVWTKLNENEEGRKRLYTYFKKVYTSPDILIFKRISL